MRDDIQSSKLASVAVRAPGALAVFTLTTFASAFLLFAVQPLFTRMVLPVLGGTPAVWAVAMVFFQAVLLMGYLYAHASVRLLPLRVAVVVHVGLMVVALGLALPITLSAAATTPPEDGYALWLVGVFLASVGLPFFAIAGNGPLLQAWYARTKAGAAGNPYRLAHASNLGSFAALMAYPLVIEPMMPLGLQAGAWSIGFGLLLMLILASALFMRERAVEAARALPTESIGLGDRLRWVLLAAIPSGLLGAVSTHIATDVASAPLLWIMPLSLFLLSFNAAFRERPFLGPFRSPLLLGVLALVQALLIGPGDLPLPVLVAVKLFGFFVLATACHARLYACRPQAASLTEFYLFMSLGGVLGGAFASLAAPVLFNDVLEYPFLLAAAVLVLATTVVGDAREYRLAARWAALAAIVAVAVLLGRLAQPAGPGPAFVWMLAALTLAGMLATSRHALALSVVAAVGIATLPFLRAAPGTERIRSFFGVHRITTSPDGTWRMLAHGTTIHGMERLKNDDGTPVSHAPEPLTYYHATGPMAETLQAMRDARGATPLAVGIVGLGAGSLTCHAKPGDSWSYFEIDPEVIAIARDPARFRFLSACMPDARMVIGDARLTLARDATRFDALVIDAFSSDAVPVHLLTREALALYLDRLRPGGVLALHISNRHMDLESVVATTAAAAGAIALVKTDLCLPAPAPACPEGKTSSSVAVLARQPSDLAAFTPELGWKTPTPRGSAWSDDYANVLAAILRKYGW